MNDTNNSASTESDLLAEMVQDFRIKFKCGCDPALAESLIIEETQEAKEALAKLLKELCDLTYVLYNAKLAVGDGVIDRDVIRKSIGIFDYLDIFCDEVYMEAFKRVHAANMLKIGGGDEKVQKGPDYVEPNLMDLFDEVYMQKGPDYVEPNLMDLFDEVYMEAFKRVHEADDEKVQKGPDYVEPNLMDLV